MLEGESQGGTTIMLGIRPTQAPPRIPSSSFLPASTAPLSLGAQLQQALEEEEEEEEEEQEEQEQEQEQGRGKRRRVGTVSYREAREQGLMGSLGHSQY